VLFSNFLGRSDADRFSTSKGSERDFTRVADQMAQTPSAAPEPHRPALLWLAAGAGLSACLLYRVGPAVVDLDIWHQLALLRVAWAEGALPLVDRFAYTPTVEPVVQHEWGAGAIALLLVNTLGGTGVLLLRLLLLGAVVGFTVIGARLQGAKTALLAFLGFIPILLLDQGFSTVRAQMYSFALLAVLFTFIGLDLRGRRWWIAVWIPLYIFWVNVHAGFLVGAGLFAIWWIERFVRGHRDWHIFGTGLAMAGLIFVTPYGLVYIDYLIEAVGMSRPYIVEWLPFHEQANFLQLGIFGLSAGLGVYAAWAIGPRRAIGFTVVVVAALATLNTYRIVFFYAVVWTVFVPAWLEGTTLGAALRDISRKRAKLLTGTWGAVAVIFVALLIPLQPWRLHVPDRHIPGWGEHVIYPVGPIDFLAEHGFEGNLAVFFDWGAYVQWKLHPKVLVSMDSRYEVAFAGETVVEQHEMFLAKPGWHDTLRRYPTDLVLSHVALPLTAELDVLPGWRTVYRDKMWRLYARDGVDLPNAPAAGSDIIWGEFP
jgi:hypothetical protein